MDYKKISIKNKKILNKEKIGITWDYKEHVIMMKHFMIMMRTLHNSPGEHSHKCIWSNTKISNAWSQNLTAKSMERSVDLFEHFLSETGSKTRQKVNI